MPQTHGFCHKGSCTGAAASFYGVMTPVGGLGTESETAVWLGSYYGAAWPGYFPDLASPLSREGDAVPTVRTAVGTKRGDGEEDSGTDKVLEKR